MIAKWIVVGLMVFGSLMTIAQIGKPRKPMSPGATAIATFLNAAVVVAVVIWWR